MNDVFGLLVLIIVVFGFIYFAGRCIKIDLEELEKTNPRYRKYLKDKYKL
jgi:hypothetical protein